MRYCNKFWKNLSLSNKERKELQGDLFVWASNSWGKFKNNHKSIWVKFSNLKFCAISRKPLQQPISSVFEFSCYLLFIYWYILANTGLSMPYITVKKGVNKWMKSFLPNAVLQDFALLHKVLLILFKKKKKRKNKCKKFL